MKIANLKIGSRLAIGFGIILSAMLGLAGIGVNSMTVIQGKLDYIVHDNVRKMELLNDMSKAVHVVTRVTHGVIILTEREALAEEYKKIEAARVQYNEAFAALEKMPASPAGVAARTRIGELQKRARALNNRVIELGMANQKSEAMDLLMREALPATTQWQVALEEDIKLQKDSSARDAEAARQSYEDARTFMFIMMAVTVAAGAWLAVVVARSITRPIGQAVGVARTVADGDLSASIEVRSEDETGQLLQALKDMNGSLHTIVHSVSSGAANISSAAGQIASSNLDLAARTEQQASSLEETASAVEQLTSTVKQNGDNARQANTMAASASSVAVSGGVLVAQVVETMGSINSSSRKIVDIIGVIDSIAFQTNILALNAAVEAARAGEQGRGFAVVATEVRSLAQRSAAAAKEIKTLIDASVSEVEAGSKLVSQAGSTMDDIVASVKRVTDIMGEITAASNEQELGIEQIHQAITEMDTVTQQNAALVEEAATAAASLHEQSAMLVSLVDVFKLDAGQPARPAPAPKLAVAARPAAPAATRPARRLAMAGQRQASATSGASAASASSDQWETF